MKYFSLLILLFFYISPVNSSEFKNFCEIAKSQEGSMMTGGKYFNFTKLEKFNFMDGTNLKIMNVNTKDWSGKLEFLINKELGKGKAKITLKSGNDLIQNFSWTMLNEKTLAVFQENVGGSAYKGQDVYLFIYSFKNEKDLNYVICEYGDRKMGEVKSATYTLEKGITKAEYEESTEGKLHTSFVYYQILKKLHKSRESYAIKYVTDEQMKDMKDKVKFIQDEAVKKDNLNSDEIWEKASNTYQKDFAFSVDQVTVTGLFVNEGKQLASLAMISINSTFKQFGGSSSVEKDF